jgi:hypothetical protein
MLFNSQLTSNAWLFHLPRHALRPAREALLALQTTNLLLNPDARFDRLTSQDPPVSLLDQSDHLLEGMSPSSKLSSIRLNEHRTIPHHVPYSENSSIEGESVVAVMGLAFGYYEPPFEIASLHPEQDEAKARQAALEELLRDAAQARTLLLMTSAWLTEVRTEQEMGRVGVINIRFQVRLRVSHSVCSYDSR